MSKENTPKRLDALFEVALDSSGAPLELGRKHSEPNLKVVSITREAKPATGIARDGEVHAVPMDQVVCNPQIRTRFDPGGIRELAQNIDSRGLIQPITVRWNDTRGCFLVVAGERRYRAMLELKKPNIPALIRQMSDAEAAEIQLAENLGREDLNAMDLARAYQSIMKEREWTGKELAESYGMDPSTVTRTLRLLKLPMDIQEQIASETLGPAVAREIARIKDEATQRAVLKQAQRNNLTAPQVDKLVQEVVGEKKTTPRTSKVAPKKKRTGTKQQTFEYDKVAVLILYDPTATYDDVAEALSLTSEEVELRLNNNVRL